MTKLCMYDVNNTTEHRCLVSIVVVSGAHQITLIFNEEINFPQPNLENPLKLDRILSSQ